MDSRFWVAYMFGAFQGPTYLDGDHYRIHNPGEPLRNICALGVNRNSGQERAQVAMIFREGIADRWARGSDPQISEDDLAAITSAHELGNLFGVKDGIEMGKLMSYDDIFRMLDGAEPEIYRLVFSGKALRTITWSQGPWEPPPP